MDSIKNFLGGSRDDNTSLLIVIVLVLVLLVIGWMSFKFQAYVRRQPGPGAGFCFDIGFGKKKEGVIVFPGKKNKREGMLRSGVNNPYRVNKPYTREGMKHNPFRFPEKMTPKIGNGGRVYQSGDLGMWDTDAGQRSTPATGRNSTIMAWQTWNPKYGR